jgi:predicted RNA-binding Zn ribbon-like protein
VRYGFDTSEMTIQGLHLFSNLSRVFIGVTIKKEENVMSRSVDPVGLDAVAVVGDHAALEMLNTVSFVDGELVDSWQSDGDVQRWLERMRLPGEVEGVVRKPLALLRAGRTLREAVRELVEKRKAGKRAETWVLNEFLKKSESRLELVSKKDGSYELERRWKTATAEQALAPLAEVAAELLAEGDFNLVRRCEGEQCVLWFYDRTKSHHRRWCSMAACGNRHKVAAFRKRGVEA